MAPERTQSVVVNGASFKLISVLSGVPKRSVLCPLMFLLYINDIMDKVSFTLWLLADDHILYQKIKSLEDLIRVEARSASLTQMTHSPG